MGDVPDYDDTDMTNAEFEAAFADSEPVDLWVPSVRVRWVAGLGFVESTSSNSGGISTVKQVGPPVARVAQFETEPQSEERHPATV